jgi:hypothetical protein
MKSESFFAKIVCVVSHHYCAWKRSQRLGFHIAGASCARGRRRSGHSCCANWQDLWCYCYCSCQVLSLGLVPYVCLSPLL